MNFLIPKDDVLRHKLLEILFNRIISFKGRRNTEEQIALPVVEVAKMLNIPLKKLDFIAMSLSDNEIRYEEFGSNKGLCLLPQDETGSSFTNKKYLMQGKTHILARLKDYFGITTAIIAIITAIITATTAIMSIKNNQKRIEDLEIKYQKLKALSIKSIQLKK